MLSKIPNSHADVMSNGCETSMSQYRDSSSLCSVRTLIETFRANTMLLQGNKQNINQ